MFLHVRWFLLRFLVTSIAVPVDLVIAAGDCTPPRQSTDFAWADRTLPGRQYDRHSVRNIPGGPWTKSARDISLQGSRLCADLRRDDKTWNRDCVLIEVGPAFQNQGGVGVAVELGQTFKNDNGLFRVILPSQPPAGDWLDTARAVTVEGDQLCAQLRRVDLSWVFSCVTFERDQVFYNHDGQFRLKVC
eukprot:TRINITY_DN16648_c0_g1_i1.p1 TRINITY_DN16648_c0_g1~~TRINITY_DN16648_c0_g1_i1.p1  ORF type:complete len:189 (-),score=19.45 TRINITY_DN16648_c0_g1_i1:256-822(-)